MPLKQRAVNDEQRLERRQVLLEAAWQLFQDNSYEKINIADVAHVAGLAKGTVYLYFPTKEALFLAVQAEQLVGWFDELEQELSGLGGVGDASRVASIICATLSRRPALTRLFAILHTVLEQNIDYPTALAFKKLLLERILRLGTTLEASLPFLQPGQGAQTALWIYTFLLGLQQLTNPAPLVREVIAHEPGMGVFAFDFCHECQAAVTTFLIGLENRKNENGL
ncbi:MAG: TetR/AcrR family transcriptional regulator [Chloroflexi bacterium]|nr:TetR/AcrR family transcriptional regulator [Chloroflexota bacterium]